MSTQDSSSHLTRTLDKIDDANRKDPRMDYNEAGNPMPSELLYSRRMSDTLQSFCPDASEVLQIATHAQHIERWKIPRNEYPMDRKGYLLWRNQLKKFHGERTAEIMQELGYNEEIITRVKTLLSKKQLKRDPEVQMLEDVICLVFLRYYFTDFAQKHPEEKVTDIVAKTWKKMSEAGQQAALELPLSTDSVAIIKKALA